MKENQLKITRVENYTRKGNNVNCIALDECKSSHRS